MRSSSARTTPFDQGVHSVRLRDDTPNPFAKGSVEFGNFELGRSYALRNKRTSDRSTYLESRA